MNKTSSYIWVLQISSDLFSVQDYWIIHLIINLAE